MTMGAPFSTAPVDDKPCWHVAYFLPAEAFLAGDWLAAAERLLVMPRRLRHVPNGADRAAEFILDLL
jgi:hypothetical protein